MDSYSHSSLGLYEQCPKAFEHKYVNGEDEAFSTIEQHVGKTVHAALQEAYAQKAKTGPMDELSIQRSYNQLWNCQELSEARIIKRGISASNYYFEGLEMLKSYYSRIYAQDDSESLQLENRFVTKIKSNGKAYDYSGVIDRLSKQSTGSLRITDYKTGKSVRNPLEDFQLRSYSFYVFTTFEEVDEIELCYEDLRGALSLKCSFAKKQVQNVIDPIVEKIERIERTVSYPAKPSILCDWCGYNEICGERMHRGSYIGINSWVDESIEEVFEPGDACPRCGAELVEREGRRGAFLGCSDFPKCRFTQDL